MRFPRFLPAILGLALLVPAMPTLAGSGPAGPAVPKVSVDAVINACSFGGTATSIPTDTLTVKHRAPSGALRKTHTLSVSFGFWNVPCPGPALRTGDKLQFFVPGGVTPFRVQIIPALTVRTDRVHDRIRGTAPSAVGLVQLRFGACDPVLVVCVKGDWNSLSPDPQTGAFELATGDDLTGGMLVTLLWTNDDDEIALNQHVARMVVRPGNQLVTGLGSRISQSVALSLRRGQAVGLANPTTGSDATFSGTFKRNGNPMKPKAGDLVSASFAGDAVMTVPQTSIALSVEGVEGRCFKNRDVTVQFRDAGGVLQSYVETTTDGTGHWDADEMIPAGTRILAWCGNAKGDAILLKLVAN